MTVTYLPFTEEVHDLSVRANFEYIESHAVFDTTTKSSSMFRTAAWSLPNAVLTTVPFDTVDRDPYKNLSVPAGTYTVVNDGEYEISACIGISVGATLTDFGLWVKQNSALFEGVRYSATQLLSVTVYRVLACKAGDILSVQGWQSSGAPQPISLGVQNNHMTVRQTA